MFKFNKNAAGNSDHQTFNGPSSFSDPTIAPDSGKKEWLFSLKTNVFLFILLPPLVFCTIPPFPSSNYVDFVSAVQNAAHGFFPLFFFRVFGTGLLLYSMLTERSSFLFMLYNNNNNLSAMVLYLRSFIFLLFTYFCMSILLFLLFTQIPFVLFPRWLGMDAFQENISQIKLDDFPTVFEWFPVTFTEILMLIPIDIFFLWSAITRRKGSLLHLRYNSLNLACALAFITGYHYLASYLSFSVFDRNWPPIIMIIYLVVATVLYFCISCRNIRQAVSNIDEISFYNRSPRFIKIRSFINKHFLFSIYLTLLCYVAVIIWNYYEGWSMRIPT